MIKSYTFPFTIGRYISPHLNSIPFHFPIDSHKTRIIVISCFLERAPIHSQSSIFLQLFIYWSVFSSLTPVFQYRSFGFFLFCFNLCRQSIPYKYCFPYYKIYFKKNCIRFVMFSSLILGVMVTCMKELYWTQSGKCLLYYTSCLSLFYEL